MSSTGVSKQVAKSNVEIVTEESKKAKLKAAIQGIRVPKVASAERAVEKADEKLVNVEFDTISEAGVDAQAAEAATTKKKALTRPRPVLVFERGVSKVFKPAYAKDKRSSVFNVNTLQSRNVTIRADLLAASAPALRSWFRRHNGVWNERSIQLGAHRARLEAVVVLESEGAEVVQADGTVTQHDATQCLVPLETFTKAASSAETQFMQFYSKESEDPMEQAVDDASEVDTEVDV